VTTDRSHDDLRADHDRAPQRAPDEHRALVLAAEVRRLQRWLLAIGPMPRHKLAEACAADRWREGTVEEAIRAGVRSGRLRELPLGWVEAINDASGRRPN